MTTVTQSPKATASKLVQRKALALYDGGKVRKVSEDRFSRTYRVRGDYGLIYSVLQHKENIDADRCTCAWNMHQPFNTAVCSHVLAARYESIRPIAWWRKALLRLAERIGR